MGGGPLKFLGFEFRVHRHRAESGVEGVVMGRHLRCFSNRPLHLPPRPIHEDSKTGAQIITNIAVPYSL